MSKQHIYQDDISNISWIHLFELWKTPRNMTVFYNFGPVALVPLPFTCRMIKDEFRLGASRWSSVFPRVLRFSIFSPSRTSSELSHSKFCPFFRVSSCIIPLAPRQMPGCFPEGCHDQSGKTRRATWGWSNVGSDNKHDANNLKGHYTFRYSFWRSTPRFWRELRLRKSTWNLRFAAVLGDRRHVFGERVAQEHIKFASRYSFGRSAPRFWRDGCREQNDMYVSLRFWAIDTAFLARGLPESKGNLRFATVLGDRQRVFNERVAFRLTLPIPPGGIE